MQVEVPGTEPAIHTVDVDVDDVGPGPVCHYGPGGPGTGTSGEVTRCSRTTRQRWTWASLSGKSGPQHQAHGSMDALARTVSSCPGSTTGVGRQEVHDERRLPRADEHQRTAARVPLHHRDPARHLHERGRGSDRDRWCG